jgi:diguanylate cyclase (GGDEF)-like protein
MIDIDHFKKFNDKHGHEVGDQVLKMVARRLVSVGDGGRAFRYGGEEFAVVFPDRSAEEILPELEKLRQNVASARFIPRGKDRPEKKPKTTPRKSSPTKSLSVTISIGAAEPSSQKRSPEQVMVGADQALYRAKQQGRNRVCS